MKISMRVMTPVLISLATAALPALSTPVSGQANISGTAFVSNSFLDFGPISTPGATNTFHVDQPDTGDFTGLMGGWIRNLTGTPTVGKVTVNDYAEFYTPAHTIVFNLTGIAPGSGTAAQCTSDVYGNTCTPTATSPFTLIQSYASIPQPDGTVPDCSAGSGNDSNPNLCQPEVAIKLSMFGQAFVPPAGGGSTSFTSEFFTTQNLIPGTITGILTELAGGGSVEQSFSATVRAISPVPEPASLLFMGVGLLGLGIIARKRIKA